MEVKKIELEDTKHQVLDKHKQSQAMSKQLATLTTQINELTTTMGNDTSKYKTPTSPTWYVLSHLAGSSWKHCDTTAHHITFGMEIHTTISTLAQDNKRTTNL